MAPPLGAPSPGITGSSRPPRATRDPGPSPASPPPSRDAQPATGGDVPARAEQSGGRLIGLDVARALAIAGMLVAHYTTLDGTGGAWRYLHRVVDGKAMPLFVLLGGMGLTLLTRRARHPARAVLGRALVLFVLGLIMVDTIPLIAVVLHCYAAYFVVGLAVRRLGDHALLAVAVAVAVAGSLTWLLIAPDLATYQGWEGWATVTDPVPLVEDLLITGYYPVLPSFAFFATGMWLARRRIGERQTQLRILAAGIVLIVVGYGGGELLSRQLTDEANFVVRNGEVELAPAEAALVGEAMGGTPAQVERWVDATEQRTGEDPRRILRERLREAEEEAGITRWARLADPAGHENMPAWLLGATGFSLMVVALSLLAVAAWPTVLAPLAFAGQLALTFYVGHSLAMRWWWYENLSERYTYAQEVLIVAGIFAGFVLLATLWRSRFRRGPLEEVLRLAGGRT